VAATVVLVAQVAVPSSHLDVAQAAPDPCEGSPRAAFVDVRDASTHARGVDCLLWFDITRGVSSTRFAPGSGLRRDQLASLLDRAITVSIGPLPDPAVPSFDDVDGVHAAAIERLAAAGIVDGRGPSRFDPEAPVRRDQFATMMVRAHQAIGGTVPVGATHGFVDLDGNVHGDAVATAVALGLVTGVDAQHYGPRAHLSRGQAATVLGRWLGLLAVDDVTDLRAGGYAARIAPLPADLRALVERTTWRAGCPVGPDALRSIELVHTDLTGRDRWGRLVVHRDIAAAVAGAFGELHEGGFRIASIVPIEHFGGDDDASMAANNTSAFNCRPVAGTTRWSEHAYGTAIDLNPVQNPYVRGSTVLPSAGRSYLDRNDLRPGMLARGAGVEAFTRLGWGWGGDWTTLKDYQHVSRSGR
jgi:hypothetical protein